jgi:uncharacterized protein YggE
MLRYALPLLAATTALSAPARAAEIQIAVQNPVVELTISEVVRADPDLAHVGAGVQTRGQTASEAVQLNAAQMERLIARLRSLGIERNDIQTSNFSLNAEYDYNNRNGAPPVFTGYAVSNQVTVRLKRLDRIGQVLDALVGAGANNIFGPNFLLENDVEAKAVARRNAFQRARVQAEEFARMAGYSGVRLLEVSETFQSFGPMPAMEGAITVTGASRDAKTPIEPGQVGTGVTLTTKYEMTR